MKPLELAEKFQNELKQMGFVRRPDFDSEGEASTTWNRPMKGDLAFSVFVDPDQCDEDGIKVGAGIWDEKHQIFYGEFHWESYFSRKETLHDDFFPKVRVAFGKKCEAKIKTAERHIREYRTVIDLVGGYPQPKDCGFETLWS